MVEDDGCLREGARQLGKLHQLRVVEPRFEGELQRRQARNPARQVASAIWPFGEFVRPRENVSLGVPDHRMANAAEAAVTGGDLCLKHACDSVPEAQIGVADDTGAQPALAVAPASAHCRGAIDELDFADRLHLGRTVGPVHRTAFDKDAVRNVVPAAGVGEQLVHQVAVLVAVP
jgi:hypothetical protein